MMLNRARGFTYVVVMFAVAIAAIFATRALQATMTEERRQREQQLLEVGNAYRAAIKSYYENSTGTAKVYPEKLADLLEDNRTSTLRRHLRKLYPDPMGGNAGWGLVKTEDGRIMGVYSLSQRAPLKTGGFPPELAHFAGASTYAGWQFKYVANH